MNSSFRLLILTLLLPSIVFAGDEKRTTGILAAGTKWETPWYSIDSTEDGPTVLITGGFHGNEPAGAHATEQMRSWSLKKGKVLLLPRGCVPALNAATREIPGAPKELANANRNFPLTGRENRARGEMAQAIWAFVQQTKPDWHLDLHEGYGVRGAGSKSVGSTVIRMRHPKTKEAQDQMLAVVNADITDEALRFVPLFGCANGSLARACNERMGTAAFICETTYTDQDLALRIRQHRLMVHALLAHLEMVESGAIRMVPPRGVAHRPEICAAIYNGPGAGAPALFSDLLGSDKHIQPQPIHPADIRDGALSQFDLIVFGGGSGSGQARGLEDKGRAAVVQFVGDGGGYLGVCAGAYLATAHYDWSLGLINVASLDTKHWRRGNAMLKMELTPGGQKIFHREEKTLDISFRQGPILGPKGREDLSAYEVLGWFRTGVGKGNADPQVMIGTPAIVFSPHPEKTNALHDLILHGARWAARASDR